MLILNEIDSNLSLSLGTSQEAFRISMCYDLRKEPINFMYEVITQVTLK